MEPYTGCYGNTNKGKLTHSGRGDCMGIVVGGGGVRYGDLWSEFLKDE